MKKLGDRSQESEASLLHQVTPSLLILPLKGEAREKVNKIKFKNTIKIFKL
jgi:hypothetical protein